MKFLLLNLLLLVLSTGALSQNSVTGKLISTDGKPLAYSNVLLLNPIDSALVKGTLTDESGEYEIDNIRSGNYFIKYSAIGFESHQSSVFKLAPQETKNFGMVVMNEDIQQLNEVIVRTAKQLYQQQMDGTVVNVGSSVLTKGSSALQVIERSPGVFINPQNNSIALNGKSGVILTLNGKIVRMPTSELISFLNGISADNIDKIELLTNPSSKYDAEGNAGIINIVTKKSEEYGTTGSISLTGGLGWGEKGTGSINLSHRAGKINTYGSYSFSHDRSFSHWFARGFESVPVMGGDMEFDFLSGTKVVRKNHNASLGLDVDLNSKTTIGTGVNLNSSLTDNNIVNIGEYTIKPDSFSIMEVNIKGTNSLNNLVSNFYIEREIQEGEKINFDIDYLYYINKSPTDINAVFRDREGVELLTDGEIISNFQRGKTKTPIQVGVIKIDYQKRLGDQLKLEAGIKGTYTQSLSLSKIESLVDNEWVSSPRTHNDIDMKERIGAAYLSLDSKINSSTNLIMGVRYEYSDTQMDAIKEENEINRKFGKLFPSIFFSKKINENSEFLFTYSKRISRPTYNDLTSSITYNDPISAFTGNSSLQSVITNNIKVGYNFHGYLFSLTFSRDDRPIAGSQITANQARDLIYIAPQNLKYQNNLIFESNLPVKVNNWWSMNYGFVGGFKQFKLDHTKTELKKTYFAYSINGQNTFEFPQKIFLEVSGWYTSPSYNGSIKLDGFGVLNAGIKKELKRNLGSIQLSISDLLKTFKINSYIGHLTEEVFFLKSSINYQSESSKTRIIKLTYTRSFGNNKIRSRNSREIGSKDERDRIRKD